MQIREAAEQVLFGSTLEEKLFDAPALVGDDRPGAALRTPVAPGRPAELIFTRDGVRAGFPGTKHLEDERQRGVLLHFLANHELLASELMALVLLKFPDAPPEFRAGVYQTMREEQLHTRLYLRRMAECGVEFGELPVNGYFWRTVAPMETPMDFVSRLSLTFEQANLDFSKHYATLFRAAGDGATAAVLEKIYRDEIAHVGHGLEWFRRWKDAEDSDWSAFGKALCFPLAPAKAKGAAPFNAEGRRAAGLDEDFIAHLEVCEQSRGRTPVVHWFNPHAESHARGSGFVPNRYLKAMQEDLELLMMGACRRDDALLMRVPPTREHLAQLKRAGFELPELTTLAELAGRKLGGLRPWAWSPDASDELRPLAGQISAKVTGQWREPLPADWLSKGIGLQLEQRLGEQGGVLCADVGAALQAAQHRPVLIKALHACAGRGHYKVEAGADEAALRAWVEATLEQHGAVVVEPWLHRVLDFSAQYEIDADGAQLVGLTLIDNDAAGRFRGIRVAPRFSKLLPAPLAEFLYRDPELMDRYRVRIPMLLPELLPGYLGPVGVDAMVHRLADGGLALRTVVELNVRTTMGRLALGLQRRTSPDERGELRLLRKAKWDGVGTALNDPSRAREFLAIWTTG